MSMFPQSGVRPVELEYGADNRVVFNFFNAVYGWMAVALAVTAAVAYLVSQTPSVMSALYGSGSFGIIALFLGAWALAYGAQHAAVKINANLGIFLFMCYAALIGALISGIFIVYPKATLVSAFVLTAGTFACMSIYGFVTRRDLTTIGSYLVMAAFGLFFASIVNVFFASDALSWFLTYAILLVFVGLVAFHTQQLRNMATEIGSDGNRAGRYAVVGSIILYIAFINIFMSILRIMGGRK
ncbi:MAG: Bax inhibitor-1/YccA family protein [Burkholderiales bacterium]|nr:Bax inhibitor-1/YccA family protein [Phycisphaerae bacterium]